MIPDPGKEVKKVKNRQTDRQTDRQKVLTTDNGYSEISAQAS